jgi:hypothetical protein
MWPFVMFFALDLDHTNVSQANTDNFLHDLRVTTNDFNLGNTYTFPAVLFDRGTSVSVDIEAEWVPTYGSQ